MTASGTFGCGEEYSELVDIGKLGAIVTKTVTLEARTGNAPPRIAEIPGGMLNSIGLENKGIDSFIAHQIPFARGVGTKVIASIAGHDEKGFAELGRRLEATLAVDALELNLSCPNIRYQAKTRLMIAQDPSMTARVVRAVRKAVRLPLIAKLSPNVTDITVIARAAEDAGADGLALVNTFPAMGVDVKRARAVLGNVTGGLSGPALKPIALKMVWDTYRAVRIPIVGIGGIMTAADAIEFILCGATAVQVGTAHFIDPSASSGIVDGIRAFVEASGVKNLAGIRGALKT